MNTTEALEICLERTQKIYDAVHGFIRFNDLERMLIDSQAFQRLHHIHQLGIAYTIYPGATHTRFEHSLGTMELATQILERITAKGFAIDDQEYWVQVVRLAALCHDLGHLPFSHDAEKELLGPLGHEEWTFKAIQSEELKEIWHLFGERFSGKDVVQDILKIAIGEKKLKEMGMNAPFTCTQRVLSQVITGDFFGADRIDYLLRDAQCTGVSYGLFDYHQLIEMLCVISWKDQLHLGIEENGIESCEALLLARHFMHRRVYQYPSVKTHKFHLARFMQGYFAAHKSLKDLDEYLFLSDCEILTALKSATKDPSACGHKDAAAVLMRVRRFKAIEIGDIPEKTIRTIQNQLNIPKDALFLEFSTHSPYKGLTFPVHMRSGTILPAQDVSKISLPANPLNWAYVAPEFENAFREAIQTCD